MSQPSHSYDWMKDAISFIESDVRKHFTIQEIASKVGTNSYSLKHEFKKAYRMGPYEYLLEARLKKATGLLLHTDDPIKDICQLVGYKSPSSFIVVFKKKYAITPLAWRKRERQKEN